MNADASIHPHIPITVNALALTNNAFGQPKLKFCADARFDSHRVAKENPHRSESAGKREFLGDCGPVEKCPSSGGGTRTPDTRIMIPLL